MQQRPAIRESRKLRQILLGWGLTLLALAAYKLSGPVGDRLSDNVTLWISAVFLLFIAGRLVRFFWQRYFGRAKTIGEKTSVEIDGGVVPPPREPDGFLASMMVPALGFALPLAFYAGAWTAWQDGSVSAAAKAAGLSLMLALPIVLIIGAHSFESDRPGQFGPENFKLPDKKD